MPEGFRNLLDRFATGRRLLLLVVGLGGVVAVWGFSRWASAPAWVPLFPGMSLEAAGEVSGKLEEDGVSYRLERGGSEVLVPESELARVRVLLAKEGIPQRGRPGFELFDQPSWGMTDFTQRINYRRALEGELERTISAMRGIEAAQVHLALQESTPFRRTERPEEASVVLKLNSGTRPGSEVVEGIRFLVASSVDGLESAKVTVLDDSGRLLSAADEAGTPDGLNQRQLEMRREVEAYLETKAEELVGQMVGASNVRVRVAANLNFDRLDRTVQKVNPDEQVPMREEKSEIVPGPNVPGAGSSATATTYETSRQVETFSSGTGRLERLTVAVLLNERVQGTGEQAQTVARSAEELARVEALVRNAVGIDAARGDEISVVSLPFDTATGALVAREEAKPAIWDRVQTVQRPATNILGLFMAFFVAIQLIRALRQPASGRAGRSGGALEAGASPRALPIEQTVAARAPEIPQRNIPIRENQPEMAARVLRAWIKDA